MYHLFCIILYLVIIYIIKIPYNYPVLYKDYLSNIIISHNLYDHST